METHKSVENSFQRIMDSLGKKDYRKAEQLSITEILKQPLHSQLWLCLGHALLNQGYGESAKHVFDRAWLLDPQATWVDTVRNEVAKLPKGHNKDTIDSLLEARAVTVAAGILVKNEERSIHRCLSSIANAVDEIVVVDTGSTDSTLEIVKSFPNVKIVNFDWCDDFAAARNAGITHMESDWVIWLDADEYLLEEDQENIKLVASLFDKCVPTAILRIGIFNQIGNSVNRTYEIVRMFPLKRGLRYWGRIHEQVGPSEGSFYSQQFYIPAVRVRLMHDGYEPSIMQLKNKASRNLALLEKMIEENPDDPTWLLFYGRETLLLKKDLDKAINLLSQAEERAKQLEWFGAKLEIYRLLIEAYLSKGDLDTAEATCYRAVEVDENFPDVLYYLSHIQLEKAMRMFRTAEQMIQKTKQAFHVYRGKVSPDSQISDWKADLMLADVFLLSGNLHKAKPIYQELLTRKPELSVAQKQLQNIEAIRNVLNRSFSPS